MKLAVLVLACAASCEPRRAAEVESPPPAPRPEETERIHEIDASAVRAAGGLVGVARAVPKLDGDRAIGYAVYPGKDRGLLARLGLRSGDVILAVNGLRLGGNAEKAFLVGSILKQTASFELEVQRAGEKLVTRIRLGGGTLGDAVEVLEPPADYDDDALDKLVEGAFENLDARQIAPSHYAFNDLRRGAFAAMLAPGRRLRAYVGRDLRDGLPLVAPAGSWLARLGMQSGDVLVGIGPRDVRSLDDLASSFYEQVGEPRVELRLRRAGHPLAIVYEGRKD